jgi:hypothetical protein
MRKIGTAGSAPLLVIISLLALLGFFAWLYMQANAEAEEIPVEIEAERDALVLSDLGGAAGDLVGKNAEIESAMVERGLGRGVFTLTVGESMTYPVLLSADLIAQGAAPDGGDRVNLRGRVYTLNDSIRSAWLEQGAIESLAGISAAESFLLVDSLRVTN